MKKSIVFLVILPVLWLAGCAGLVPPVEEDPNTITLIFKNGDQADGRILEIKNEFLRFMPDNWVQYAHLNRSIRADEVKFIELPNGSRFTFKDFVDYRWEAKSPAPLLGSGVTKNGQKEVTEATAGQDLQYEQLKKKAISAMTPNEFSYFMLMKQQDVKAQQEKRVQSTPANATLVKKDSSTISPLTFSLLPRAETKISKMDFRNLMEQLHQRFGATVTMGDFRLLVTVFQEEAARALREILNHYTDWRYAFENKHPLDSKNFGK